MQFCHSICDYRRMDVILIYNSKKQTFYENIPDQRGCPEHFLTFCSSEGMKFYALRKNSKAVACGTIILKVLVAMYNLKISAPHYNYILRKICDKVHNVFLYSMC